MKKIVLCGLAALSLAVSAGNAFAACRWTYVNGHQEQLCDNTYDAPTMRPLMPAAPMVPPSIAPIQTPTMPPLGTRSCQQEQVWNGHAYQWQSVCH